MFSTDTVHTWRNQEGSNRLPNGGPVDIRQQLDLVSPKYLPGGRSALAGIAVRGFVLGIALGISLSLTVILAYGQSYLWRAPFFVATLSTFHYLEFDMTARHNTADAKVSSYLLSSNGSAYNLAHATAIIELLLRSWLRSVYGPKWLHFSLSIPETWLAVPRWVPTLLGLTLVIGGQYVRSVAMATAGKSFNHLVQSTKKGDHRLITHGIYAFSRHPSYLGFFWWGIGTQLAVGNQICLLGYAYVLWHFFASRITSEFPPPSRAMS